MKEISWITKNIEELFPDYTHIYLKKRFKTVNSEIFIADIIRDNNFSQRLLIKFCGSNNSVEVLNEFRNLSTFEKECKDERISAPKPLRVDPKNGLIIMECIEGVNLKQLLLKLRHVNKNYLDDIVDLSAIALSKYHNIFRVSEFEDLIINSPLLLNSVNTDLSNTAILQQCNLNIKVKTFIDFAAWNIILEHNLKKVFLIDFPEDECICTPHLDLARFKFSLKIIKNYPQFRFLKINWWDENHIFNNFLGKYCKEMKINLNEHDMAIIDYFVREYVKKIQNIYDNNQFNMRFKLEKVYLRHFIEAY